MAVSQYPRSHERQPVMGYSLRRDQWRYTEWHRKDGTMVGRELYDHSASDVAKVNVVDKPENTGLAKKLSAQLTPFVKTRWESFGGVGKKPNDKPGRKT